MLSTKRDKVLMMVLIAVMLLGFAEDTVMGLLLSPFSQQTQTRDSLRRKVAERERDLSRVEAAQQTLRQANQISLPPDPSVATTLYQNWLVETAQQSGLTNAVVTPGLPIRERDAGHRISMTLQAETTAPRIGQLLDRLQNTSILHRVSHVSLIDAGGKTAKGTLRLMLNLEALSLSTSEPRSTLMPSNDHPTLPELDRAEQSASDSLAQVFIRSPLFDRIEPRVFKPTAAHAPNVAKQTPAQDSLSRIRFVGTWQDGSRNEAWFFDELQRQKFVVVTQDRFQFGQLAGQVLEVHNDKLKVDVEGHHRELMLGQALSVLSNTQIKTVSSIAPSVP